ncbi:MAG: hypothetical protein D6759_12010 [Chloroflexi bacterium]|nr:MAG: hypothetical protein D6759_12010 [Chloroflexota bacterium]
MGVWRAVALLITLLLLRGYVALEDWVLAQMAGALERDLLLETIPLVLPGLAGAVLYLGLLPQPPRFRSFRFNSATFVFLGLLPTYLALGRFLGLALGLPMWAVGGSQAPRLAALWALIAGAGIAASFIRPVSAPSTHAASSRQGYTIQQRRASGRD